MFVEEICHVFEDHDLDFIISPTTIGEEPPKIRDMLDKKEKTNPVYEYKMDYSQFFSKCL